MNVLMVLPVIWGCGPCDSDTADVETPPVAPTEKERAEKVRQGIAGCGEHGLAERLTPGTDPFAARAKDYEKYRVVAQKLELRRATTEDVVFYYGFLRDDALARRALATHLVECDQVGEPAPSQQVPGDRRAGGPRPRAERPNRGAAGAGVEDGRRGAELARSATLSHADRLRDHDRGCGRAMTGASGTHCVGCSIV